MNTDIVNSISSGLSGWLTSHMIMVFLIACLIFLIYGFISNWDKINAYLGGFER